MFTNAADTTVFTHVCVCVKAASVGMEMKWVD